MSFGQRLKEERKKHKLTQEELAKSLGIHKTSLLSYEKDSVSPPASFLEKLSSLSFDVNYIITGAKAAVKEESKEENDDSTIHIPVVNAVLCAGYGSLETEDNIVDRVPFPRAFIQQKGNPNNMVLFRVSGDSMAPTIYDKDMVLIDESKKTLETGKIYAVGFEDVIYLKQIDFLPKTIVLKSHNKDYKDIELEKNEYNDDQFRVIGKVLWVSREF